MHVEVKTIRPKIGVGEFWAIGSALAYAFDNLFSAIAVRGQGINFFLGSIIRSIPVLLFVTFISLFFIKDRKTQLALIKDRRNLGLLATQGTLAFFIGNTMFFAALNFGGVLITTPLAGTQALWAALIALIALKQSLNWKMVLGLLITVGGITVLALGKAGVQSLPPRWWLAVPLALGTAICWALSGVIVAYVQQRGVNRFPAMTLSLATGLILLNIYLLISGQIGLYTATPISQMGNTLFAGLFNMGASIAIITALGLTSVASATTLGSLQVGIAPILAWIFLNEQINLPIVIGILFIMVGVIFVQIFRKIDR